MSRTGVWLVGARGNIATTAIVGARAIARDVSSRDGMVTERDPVNKLDLPPVDQLVFGGHDIRNGTLVDTAKRLGERNGVPDLQTVSEVQEDLERVEDRIEVGTTVNTGRAIEELADGDHEIGEESPSTRAIVERIREDYRAFKNNFDLERVVVVNVASSEPVSSNSERFETIDQVERAINSGEPELPPSSLYAYAALVDGHPYLNFTPSTGSSLGGLCDLAEREEVPHMGQDGKTGETLVKSALAPMFTNRNLRVLSWESHNILGNTDGEVLEEDANKEGKVETKRGLLEEILGYSTHHEVRIDYTPSLADWKTAWDHVHFRGFLETDMKLQFTWEGSDSALAAPLVLDMARLLAYADKQDEAGLQPHLASFFKSPLGVEEHDLSRQFDLLYEYVANHADGHSIRFARISTEGE